MPFTFRTRRDLCSTGVRRIDSIDIEGSSQQNVVEHRAALTFETASNFNDAIEPISDALTPIEDSVNSVSFDSSDITNEVDRLEGVSQTALENAKKASIVATGIKAKIVSPFVRLGAMIASPFVKLGVK